MEKTVMTEPVNPNPPGGPQLPLVRDAYTNQYINQLGRQIAAQADPRGISYTFYIINADVLGAFSIPGGYVYVNRGLIERSDNVSQLAGVLAHEIGHVVERHGDDRSAQTEREADHGALIFAMRSGYNPAGLVRFLEKVQALREQTPRKVEQWLAAHPITKERLQTIEAVIAATPGAQSPKLVTDTPEFQNFRDRLRTVTPPAEDR
jgi:predicted Zn-dependent protease